MDNTFKQGDQIDLRDWIGAFEAGFLVFDGQFQDIFRALAVVGIEIWQERMCEAGSVCRRRVSAIVDA